RPVDDPAGAVEANQGDMATHAPISINSPQAIAAARRRAPAAPSIRVPCDPTTHQICVVDERGALLGVFGDPGALPGQFDRPSDVIVVSPRFDGEEMTVGRMDLVVVADR